MALLLHDRTDIADATSDGPSDLSAVEILHGTFPIRHPWHAPKRDRPVVPAPAGAHTSPLGVSADHLWDVLRDAEEADDEAVFHRLLRRAMHLAVLAGSRIDPVGMEGDDLLDELRWFAQGLGSEAHYQAFPAVRPTLEGITRAYARQRHSPVAMRPDILAEAVRLAHEAAGDVPTPRDVFFIATALLAGQ